MNKNITKLGDKVLQKMSAVIVSDKKLTDMYFNKWNINGNDIVNQLSSVNLHGGTYSKNMSLKNIKFDFGSSILNIGPETGYEVFLLAELFANVHVCDPDEDNLALLKRISKKYYTEVGTRASDKTTFLPYGINNKQTITGEKRIFKSLESIGLKGLPTFYNLTSKKEVGKIIGKFDVIFIHKILTTITRSATIPADIVFLTAIKTLKTLLKDGGQIFWTEPEAIWSQNNIDVNLFTKTVFKYKLRKLNESYVQIAILC